jgi:hypothetical protein
MTLLDFGMEVVPHHRAVAFTALDDAVLAPWSSTGSEDSATRANYSTGRAAYGFSAQNDLRAQLLALNHEVALILHDHR